MFIFVTVSFIVHITLSLLVFSAFISFSSIVFVVSPISVRGDFIIVRNTDPVSDTVPSSTPPFIFGGKSSVADGFTVAEANVVSDAVPLSTPTSIFGSESSAADGYTVADVNFSTGADVDAFPTSSSTLLCLCKNGVVTNESVTDDDMSLFGGSGGDFIVAIVGEAGKDAVSVTISIFGEAGEDAVAVTIFGRFFRGKCVSTTITFSCFNKSILLHAICGFGFERGD